MSSIDKSVNKIPLIKVPSTSTKIDFSVKLIHADDIENVIIPTQAKSVSIAKQGSLVIEGADDIVYELIDSNPGQKVFINNENNVAEVFDIDEIRQTIIKMFNSNNENARLQNNTTTSAVNLDYFLSIVEDGSTTNFM